MISPILLVAVVIGSLIIIHEFGHLIIAKIAGLPVETFSVGFGPVLIKKRFGTTDYQLSLIPLGGFIKLAGDDVTSDSGFNAAPLGKKVGVIIAGPLSNLILGIILTTILFSAFGVTTPEPRIIPDSTAITAGFESGDYIVKINNDTIKNWSDIETQLENYSYQETRFLIKRNNETRIITYKIIPDSFPFAPFISPVIDRVKNGSPAEKIGLKKGDVIIQLDTTLIKEWYNFVEIIQMSQHKPIYIRWQHNNQFFEDSITPQLVPDELTQKKVGVIGIWVKIPEKPMPIFKSIATATNRSVYVAAQTFVILYKVIVGKIPKSAIGGPVMVAKYTYEGAQWGVKYLLGLWALLSINLCVINIIPIPILDGGRVLLYIIESIKRKKLSKKEWEISFWIGYGLIGLLLIFALTNDITRLIKR
jgi:regulator of sigma E protease